MPHQTIATWITKFDKIAEAGSNGWQKPRRRNDENHLRLVGGVWAIPGCLLHPVSGSSKWLAVRSRRAGGVRRHFYVCRRCVIL